MSLIKRSTPREIRFTKSNNPYAEGSIIAEFGNTNVHITASIQEDVPRWMKGTKKGCAAEKEKWAENRGFEAEIG